MDESKDLFEQHMRRREHGMPQYLFIACLDVRDILDTAKLAAKVALGSEDPAIVLAVYDRIRAQEKFLQDRDNPFPSREPDSE